MSQGYACLYIHTYLACIGQYKHGMYASAEVRRSMQTCAWTGVSPTGTEPETVLYYSVLVLALTVLVLSMFLYSKINSAS